VDLVARAEEACVAYDAEFPDERQRYGPAEMEWCRHDNGTEGHHRVSRRGA